MTTKQQDKGAGGDGDRPARRVTLSQVMRGAAKQLGELLGCDAVSVSAVKSTRDGWVADVEIVEVERIPETTSVMASYHVQLDEGGEITGYERTRRYTRGQIDRQ
ncbi:gas vesicle protein [Streptantibioticus parmotrematis]|uniref:gas vesicle protein GvpO n=1 Tax=Streptantibioticus parmotrematis TaxID=2873249 RepID=UPI00340598F6